jgi:predicted enzyme related to lactoylglutathione lyase
MIRVEPIIGVNDVEKSSAWYQELFGLSSRHGGPKFEMLADAEGITQLCLHKWGEHGHPTLLAPGNPTGNGLILYFHTNDLESIRENARRLGAVVEAEIHVNPNSHLPEFSLRDPDGYYIMVTV